MVLRVCRRRAWRFGVEEICVDSINKNEDNRERRIGFPQEDEVHVARLAPSFLAERAYRKQ
jgi:hypothetical protein